MNVVCPASSDAEFRAKVEAGLLERGLVLFELEEVESLPRRIENWEVDQTILALAEESERTGVMGVGTFHTFPSSGAD